MFYYIVFCTEENDVILYSFDVCERFYDKTSAIFKIFSGKGIVSEIDVCTKYKYMCKGFIAL